MSPLQRHAAGGFTLIELLVVMAALGLLLSIMAPRFVEHVDRSRETVLQQNLASLRASIDQFHADRDRYPATLDELVQHRYLRAMPRDPVTDRIDTWVPLPPPGETAGIGDVRSGARGTARDGTAYATW